MMTKVMTKRRERSKLKKKFPYGSILPNSTLFAKMKKVSLSHIETVLISRQI
jgi:hypothetical protein